MSKSMNPQNHVSRRLFLAILGSASVAAGCSREESDAARAAQKPASGAEPAVRKPKKLSEIVVGFSQTGAESSWRIAHSKSIQERKKKKE